ncbi:hypothetical protein AAG906_012236 [Vitis piasezkii]
MATSSSDSFPIAINATRNSCTSHTNQLPSWHAQFEFSSSAITSLAMLMALILSTSTGVKRCMPLHSSPLTSYQAWTKPTKLYASRSRTCVMQLKEDLTLMQRGNRSITEYLHSVKTIAGELALIDAPLSQDDITLYVLHGLGSDFRDIVARFEPESSTLFEELHDLLLVIIGDGSGLPIIHFGSLTLSFPNKNFKLKILYVFLPLTKLDIFTTSQSKTMIGEREILLQGPCENGVYPLPSSPVATPIAFVHERTSVVGWHQRLGHPSSKVVTRLIISMQLPTDSSPPKPLLFKTNFAACFVELPAITQLKEISLCFFDSSEDPALVQPQEAPLSTSDQVTLRPSTSVSQPENSIPSSPPPCPRTIITRSMNNIFRPKQLHTTTNCVSQALKDPHWRKAMSEEVTTLLQHGTWELVPPTPGQNLIGCKFVFE